ncbi:hypothetical protein [Noviherbaspirillum autotrophicum]|uniref:hypothetical protein n=1 Tax=Noviherbaspirillum autotrophicum TaxID=709839 RepID=UPI0018DF81D5|nr:hypothetical protein [Noviherbaspirillum autotrophicum]
MTASLLPNGRHGRFSVATLYLLLATPAARSWLEASMTGHMLLQIPLLTAIGIVSSRLLLERWQNALLAAVGGAIPCVLTALFVSSYWMLPRALDAALASPLVETAKFLSLPMLVGLPLGLAWKRLHVIGRGFVWTNFISMLAVLGWLYIVAPVRLCNNYLVDQQGQAGWWMVKLALLLFAWWLGNLFVGDSSAAGEPGTASQDVNQSHTKLA